MRELDRALADIGAMRRQLARHGRLSGYGPAAVAGTGVLAAAVMTGQWLGGSAAAPASYFTTWICTAIVCVILVGAEALTRSQRLRSKLADSVITAAAVDFAPAGLAGAGIAAILLLVEPSTVWMLPGIWQVALGLGYVAASRSLPRVLALAGCWYVVAGLIVLAFGSATHALTPWAMGIPFTIGQLMAAVLLRRSLEPGDE